MVVVMANTIRFSWSRLLSCLKPAISMSKVPLDKHFIGDWCRVTGGFWNTKTNGFVSSADFWAKRPNKAQSSEKPLSQHPSPVAAPQIASDPSPVAAPQFASDPSPVAAPQVASDPSPVAAPQVASDPSPVAAPQVASDPSPVAAPQVASVSPTNDSDFSASDDSSAAEVSGDVSAPAVSGQPASSVNSGAASQQDTPSRNILVDR